MDPSNDSVSEEHKVHDHGMFNTTFTRESWGLGCVGLKMINLPPSGGEFIMVNASCPVDKNTSILRWSMRVSKDIQDEIGMAIVDVLQMECLMICLSGTTKVTSLILSYAMGMVR